MQQNPSGIFIHYLTQLKAIINKIATHQQNNPELLYKSLHSDMLPLLAQVRTAANFSLRTCCPLAQRERINFDNHDESYTGLQQQLDQTIAYLHTLSVTGLSHAPATIQDQAGFKALDLPTDEYLNFYALPNFFFHLCMVYSIARQAGVPLSKGDFDGYHNYPDGFSFV